MIFNITGGGGSGAALNFNVVTYNTEEELLAATPSENTIGVITDTPMTSWTFSATEPNPAVPGMVWIFTSEYSVVEFNALKKNSLQVYPIFVKQYVGGSWIDKTAKSWQGGKWVDWWNGELYWNGNEYEGITGGWTTKAWAWTASGTPTKSPTIEFTDTNMVITQTQNSSDTVVSGAVIVNNDIDLTDVNSIEVELDSVVFSGTGGTPSPDWKIYIFVQDRNASQVSGLAVNSFGKQTSGTYSNVAISLNTSSITGKYCVGICTYMYVGNKNGQIVAAVKKVRCKK